MAETEGVTSAGMATVQQDDRMAKTKQYYPQELDVSDAKDHLRIIDIGESQNLKRNFTTLSIIAVAFDLTNSWVGIATTLAIAIALGGTVTLLYGIILVSFMFLANGITLAELASVYPTAGGQYHFTSVLAPKRFSKALSYCCGLLAAFSWIVTVASVTIILAQVLLAIIIQYTDSYTPETWHYFLVYQAVNALILVYNVYLTKRTTWLYDLGCELLLISTDIDALLCLADGSCASFLDDRIVFGHNHNLCGEIEPKTVFRHSLEHF
jgi:choline transport protein